MPKSKKKFRSLSERCNYHSKIANSGRYPDGKPASTCSRVQHAIRANELRQKNNDFMNGVNFANRIHG